jgi:hypothetical protein
LTNNKSASKTSNAATADATIPDDVANVNPPKKRKAKKNAMKTALPTRRNPKHKKDLDEGTVDRNFPNPPQKCQHADCDFLVHHLCQSAWEQREGHPDTVARYCCLHHPQYKYKNVIDRSGVSKRSLSSNSGREMSDTATPTMTATAIATITATATPTANTTTTTTATATATHPMEEASREMKTMRDYRINSI